MMIAIFISAAIVLVIVGGVLAATDSALGVVSRHDLLEMAEAAPRRVRLSWRSPTTSARTSTR